MGINFKYIYVTKLRGGKKEKKKERIIEGRERKRGEAGMQEEKN